MRVAAKWQRDRTRRAERRRAWEPTFPLETMTCRDTPRRPRGSLNPKVEGSNPSRPITVCLAKRIRRGSAGQIVGRGRNVHGVHTPGDARKPRLVRQQARATSGTRVLACGPGFIDSLFGSTAARVSFCASPRAVRPRQRSYLRTSSHSGFGVGAEGEASAKNWNLGTPRSKWNGSFIVACGTIPLG